MGNFLKKLLGGKPQGEASSSVSYEQLDDRQVGQMWEENAEAWAKLTRAGHDVYRDQVNTPAFLNMLPDVNELSGLDIGCGEGYNTRLVAARGARMTGIDISETLIRYAIEQEQQQPLGIEYRAASALELPFPDGTFDFAIGTMSLMDLPDHQGAVREAARVVKPGGLFQFSIAHPCFVTPRWKWHKDKEGKKVGIICGDYFDPPGVRVEEFTFNAAPEEMRNSLRKFRIPQFPRTLSSWFSLLTESGFDVVRLEEPKPDEEALKREPRLRDTRIIAYVLIFQCRRRD